VRDVTARLQVRQAVQAPARVSLMINPDAAMAACAVQLHSCHCQVHRFTRRILTRQTLINPQHCDYSAVKQPKPLHLTCALVAADTIVSSSRSDGRRDRSSAARLLSYATRV
jgi:hypothetical protein